MVEEEQWSCGGCVNVCAHPVHCYSLGCYKRLMFRKCSKIMKSRQRTAPLQIQMALHTSREYLCVSLYIVFLRKVLLVVSQNSNVLCRMHKLQNAISALGRPVLVRDAENKQ